MGLSQNEERRQRLAIERLCGGDDEEMGVVVLTRSAWTRQREARTRARVRSAPGLGVFGRSCLPLGLLPAFPPNHRLITRTGMARSIAIINAHRLPLYSTRYCTCVSIFTSCTKIAVESIVEGGCVEHALESPPRFSPTIVLAIRAFHLAITKQPSTKAARPRFRSLRTSIDHAITICTSDSRGVPD